MPLTLYTIILLILFFHFALVFFFLVLFIFRHSLPVMTTPKVATQDFA
jgi:hypothetical protein